LSYVKARHRSLRIVWALANQLAATAMIEERAVVQPHVIAIVEDDVAVRSSLKFVLEIEGFGVRMFSQPLELLNNPVVPACECFILDYSLPKMTGLELLRVLRDRGVNTPAVLITSYPSAQLQERAKHAGVPIVEKPLLENVLIDEIRKVIARGSTPSVTSR
jgi:FixJ family two-component response regulator